MGLHCSAVSRDLRDRLGLAFEQQVKGPTSVPDALISQEPLAIFVETKMGCELFNGLLYVLSTGCQWQYIPMEQFGAAGVEAKYFEIDSDHGRLRAGTGRLLSHSFIPHSYPSQWPGTYAVNAGGRRAACSCIVLVSKIAFGYARTPPKTPPGR